MDTNNIITTAITSHIEKLMKVLLYAGDNLEEALDDGVEFNDIAACSEGKAEARYGVQEEAWRQQGLTEDEMQQKRSLIRIYAEKMAREMQGRVSGLLPGGEEPENLDQGDDDEDDDDDDDNNNQDDEEDEEEDDNGEDASNGDEDDMEVDDPAPASSSSSVPGPAVVRGKNTGRLRRFQCYVCDDAFERRKSVRDHFIKRHQGTPWEARRVRVLTTAQARLVTPALKPARPQKPHNNGNFACPLCPSSSKRWPRKDSVLWHFRKCHKDHEWDPKKCVSRP